MSTSEIFKAFFLQQHRQPVVYVCEEATAPKWFGKHFSNGINVGEYFHHYFSYVYCKCSGDKKYIFLFSSLYMLVASINEVMVGYDGWEIEFWYIDNFDEILRDFIFQQTNSIGCVELRRTECVCVLYYIWSIFLFSFTQYL